MSDEETQKPWDRLEAEGESAIAYAAFLSYRDLGPSRSLRAAYRRRTGIERALQPTGHWREWVKRFQWLKRVAEWDRHLEAKRTAAIIAEHTKWAERWHADLDQIWDASEQLMGRALELLKPQEPDPDGEPPPKKPYRDITTLIDSSIKLKTLVRESIVIDPQRIDDRTLRALAEVLAPTPTGVLPDDWLEKSPNPREEASDGKGDA